MVKSKSEIVNSKKNSNLSSNKFANNTNTPSVKIVNPFDRKINKVKHEVLNRKVKGVAGNIGQSRYNAIEKRKKTLLVEMNQQNKTNKFIDSRYGENDPNMTEEDKMLARFQKEKMRNKNLYSLDDNNEEELTHLGQSLGQSLGDGVVNNDDYVASDDELDEENEFLSERSRFGGGEDGGDRHGDRHKSKKEIYQEIIEKSKQGKSDRAREKLLKEQSTRELDEEFNLIRGDLQLSSQVKSTPYEEEDAFLKFQAQSKLSAEQQKQKEQSSKKENKHDDFDDLLVQLQGETRARATDRTKTKEEIMKDEAERLAQKEKERQERASGDYVELEQDVDEKEKNLPKKVKERLKEKDNKPKMLSADSLDDDNEVLNVNGIDTTFYNPQIDSSDDGKEDDSEDDENDSEDDEDDSEDDGEDEEGEDGEDEEDEEDSDADLDDDEIISGEIEEDEEEEKSKKSKKSKKSEEPIETIPYTFDVPKSIDELDEWLENRNDEEKQTILSRIRVCNHISLKPQNKEKMKSYLPILYQRFINTASTSPVEWKELDIISKYIFEISQDVPDISGQTGKELINACYKRICKKLEIQSKLNYWPNQSELLLMKLLGNVFPTSDFQHPVCTPAVESLNFFLSHCPIKNINDIASSLFTSNLLFFYLSSSKRYSPEISSLLISLLSTFVNHQQQPQQQKSNKSIKKSTTEKNNQWASISTNILIPTIVLPESYLKITSTKSEPSSSIGPKKFEFSLLSSSNVVVSNQLKINLLNYLISFIEKYVKFYSDSQFNESLPSLFNTFNQIINKLDISSTSIYHKELIEKIKSLQSTIDQINSNIISNRKPLILLTGKPQQLRQFNPRFNQVFSFFNKDPDAERSHAKKMKSLVKKETKGAIREIVKDNQFIQAEKFKKAQLERVENDKKRKLIMSELQKEQQEGKAYKKMKDRLDGRI